MLLSSNRWQFFTYLIYLNAVHQSEVYFPDTLRFQISRVRLLAVASQNSSLRDSDIAPQLQLARSKCLEASLQSSKHTLC